MYETEANIKAESAEELPLETLSMFKALRVGMTARTVLPWSEHCTECVWPTCYTTCDMYSPRVDGRCRRFVDGMVRVNLAEAVTAYLLKVRFKPWGKLWAPGTLTLLSLDEADAIERRDHTLGSLLYHVPLPSLAKQTLIGKRYAYKKRVATKSQDKHGTPTSFLLECYSPNTQITLISLIIRSQEDDAVPFQRLISITPGYQAVRIPFDEVAAVLDCSHPFQIELIPNEVDSALTLYFGAMDFVIERETPSEPIRTVKCVVWDLDNTVWNGILIEDGATTLQPKPGIRHVVETLDRRGILQSIASKNTEAEAMEVLRRFDIADYFLCPHISFEPKSQAIQSIARHLNIGIDAMLFVDDSEFELEQVKSACSGVRVISAKHYRLLPELKELSAPVTAESRNRRKMYQVEWTRQEMAKEFHGDYREFLRQCNLELRIRPLDESNIERVHELTQRTNQMNFSGTRYERDVLRTIAQNSGLDTYVIECSDRFGSYGTVGFGIVDKRTPCLTDLMFSCRVQAKRVEHAVLGYVIRKYITMTGKDFYAHYRRTPRNSACGKVFADIGMKEVEVRDGVSHLVLPAGATVPDDQLINIIVPENKLCDVHQR